ncbi:VCBS repeat-containing protein (plasmid) [Streptomyces californicus]|uniref:VCBS repeat-containing protein n=2 Tax=Streptomyces TaxID=1883 RepID=A0ABD7DBT2_9ACTN|nr:FG-GAP-like repeat-containing protein [Streptomyces californicus]QRV39068.1 VCBS repeat-containing protein [Streptomyces californicus]QRV52521.1 VCBS repeat-containing protein [Streptomyces californicus]
MSIRRSRRVRAILFFTAAVSALTISAPVQAAVGDSVANNTYAFTAKIDIGGKRACSGSLVDPQWVLTASSCFAADGQPAFPIPAGAPAQKTTATIGRTDLSTTTGRVVEITQLVPRGDRDLVMARLARPVTGITPVAIAPTPPATGETLRAAGYGRTHNEWIPNRLHAGAFTVDATNSTTVGITSAGGAICRGDAGGPALRERNGQVELAAVHSASWQAGCFNETETRKEATETRLDNINTWIQETRFPQAVPIPMGTTLANGQSLTSRGSKLTMADGVLSITSGVGAGKVLWNAGTSGHPNAKAVMEPSGNLAICAVADTAADLDACAADTTKTKRLWSTAVPATTAGPNNAAASFGGYALLHNRGSLVLYNVKGQSLWSSGTAIRHDYNGDGRSDLATWYDYADGGDALHTMLAGPTGGFGEPAKSFSVGPDKYWADHMKFTTGDFNGDGRGDVAAFYGYDDGRVNLSTWLSKADGGFNTPTTSWSVPAGEWSFGRMTPRSGDFDGDGRDDIAVWYDYADGRDRLWTFTANQQGGFNDPFASWTGPETGWTASKSKLVIGDFDADGRDDMAALYDYGDTTVKLWTLLTEPNGGFQEPFQSWTDTTWGDWARTGVHAGDFNGDGRDDVAAWYDYADGHDGLHTFTSLSTKDGSFQKPTAAWSTEAGRFWYPSMKMAAGDYNGDGRDDLAAVHDYTDGSMKMWTWTAKTDGTFNSPLGSWNPATGWNYDRLTLIGQHH